MKNIFTIVSNLQAEMNRLQCQAEELSPFVSESMEKCEISKGMKVADIGCGTGQVSFLISRRVGPRGRVTGIDSNTTAVEFCRKTASSEKVKNVSFIVDNACDLSRDLLDNSVDISYSRFLLTHLEHPMAALKEMIRITAQEGVIMIEDSDLTKWIVEPNDQSVNQLWKWYSGIVRKKGGDPALGRKLYRMFIDQGLNPKVDVYSLPIIRTNRRMWNSIIEVLKKIDEIQNSDDLIESKREAQRSFESYDLVNGLSRFSRSRFSLFVFPIVFRVWARKT